MSSNPSVIALLPAYNASAFIDDTLRSLAAQTYANFRVLISVDLSSDDTAERCQRFANNDPRFRVVLQKQRLGWVRNSNELLSLAESDLCFFMGHDDWLEPRYVSTLVAVMLARPGAVLVYSDISVSWSDGRREIRMYSGLDGVTDRIDRGKIVLQRAGIRGVPYRGIFRTVIGKRDRPLRSHLAGEFAADWPFLLHFSLEGECVRVPDLLYVKLYIKRQNGKNLSSTWDYKPRSWLAVDICCGFTILRANLTLSERLTLLRAVARRIIMDLRTA